MTTFYRVFSVSEKRVWNKEIDAFLEENNVGLDALDVVDESEQDDLDAVPVSLVFADESGREVASLVYDAVEDSEILRDEIKEFQSIADEMVPEANRAWVKERLAKTVGCYVFELNESAYEDGNWDAIATLAEWIRSQTDGIEQYDGGVITNENGAIVLAGADDDFDDVDESVGEEDDEEDDDETMWTGSKVALRAGDAWVEKTIETDADFVKFLDGNV